MSKAFDKDWHEGLIFKLKQNGISGELLRISSDFLSNRKQRVRHELMFILEFLKDLI